MFEHCFFVPTNKIFPDLEETSCNLVKAELINGDTLDFSIFKGKKTRRNIARVNTVLNEKQKQISESTKTDEQD